MHRKLISGIALGAVATALAAAGGSWALADSEGGRVVNTPTAVAAAPTSFADIVERVAPAVVSIDVSGKAERRPVAFAQPFGDEEGANPFGFDFRQFFPDGRGERAPTPPPEVKGTGSGFFISGDGFIVTNNHVVEGADDITVRTKDGRALKARLVGRDPATDLAVVKVEGAGFPHVSFEESARPRVGDWVIAVGNPFNLGGTATAGIVSALGRSNISGSSYVDYMQIDAPINRGNSGGPTFDLNGRVVGVNSAIYSPSGGSVGIGFDIPAEVAASVSRQLIAEGKVTRGYIGASIQGLTPEIAESLGVSDKQGALVASLTPGGPSERAGLRTGDLILKVDGRDVASASDLTRRVGLVRPGEEVRLQVKRDGRLQDVVIRSGERPSEEVVARRG
jgi:serine protease Do